jgi:hypothetical protein
MAWVGFYFFLAIMAAMSPKMLGASIVTAIGFTVVYPNEAYAFGLSLGLAVAALLANFRD